MRAERTLCTSMGNREKIFTDPEILRVFTQRRRPRESVMNPWQPMCNPKGVVMGGKETMQQVRVSFRNCPWTPPVTNLMIRLTAKKRHNKIGDTHTLVPYSVTEKSFHVLQSKRWRRNTKTDARIKNRNDNNVE